MDHDSDDDDDRVTTKFKVGGAEGWWGKKEKKKKRGVLNAQNKLIEDLPFLTFLMIIFICRVEQ